MTLRLDYAARSDVGLIRDGNEDSVYAGPRLLAVADGMGGHAAGEVASRVAISFLATLDEDAPGADLTTALREAVETANDHLRDMVAADEALEGMGTTLTALLWAGQRLGLLHIGDSRAYLFRKGVLSRITRDHTLVQGLVDEGRITPEEADTHPQRNMITRALDGRDVVEPDLSVREALEGDRYLICSDGLSGVVSEQTMAEALASGGPRETVDRLVELALRGGAPDNVTVIVADLVEGDSPAAESPVVGGAVAATDGDARRDADTPAIRAAKAQSPRRQPTAADEDAAAAGETARPRRRWRVGLVALLVVLLLAAGAGGAWAYVHSQYYVGDAHGNVAVFRGVDGSVAGLHLSSVQSRTSLPLTSLSQYQQQRVREGIAADSLPAAQRIVATIREQTCHPTPTPAPSASASPPAKGHASPKPTPSPTPTPVPGCGASG